MAHTAIFNGVFSGVYVICQAINHNRLAWLHFHVMDELERFLRLKGSHDRGTGGRSRYLALQDVLAGQTADMSSAS